MLVIAEPGGRDHLFQGVAAGVARREHTQPGGPGRLGGHIGGPLALIDVDRPVDQIRQGVDPAGHRHDLDVQPGAVK